jgi:hypothetical protein
MLSPEQLYPLILSLVQALGPGGHSTAMASLAHLLTALLIGQSLRPAVLMRALLSPNPAPARQRYKRVARSLRRRWLSSDWLTPLLVRAALALVKPDPIGSTTAGLTHLALDSVRCGGWEIFTLSVVWRGRGLPVGWAVLPYPWPKGQFTPTICGLVRLVAAAWPADRAAHLTADRAFPSRRLFQTLRQVGWGWTVRLRATDSVTVAGKTQPTRELLASAKVGSWTVLTAFYGSDPQALPGSLVVGRGLVVIPWHQRTDGCLRQRAKQRAQRQRHLADKHPGRADASQQTDLWLILFTSHPTWRAAITSYRRRWATEGIYRDAQGGWDGRQGWDLERAVARLQKSVQVERVVGLWALGVLAQSAIGYQLMHSNSPQLQAVVGQWTTTNRLSIWARGRLALTDTSGQLTAWLGQTIKAVAQEVAVAPPPSIKDITTHKRLRPPAKKAA